MSSMLALPQTPQALVVAHQEPCGELDVVAGRTHRHGQRGAVYPDAEWFLGGEQVGACCRTAALTVRRERHPQYSSSCRAPGPLASPRSIQGRYGATGPGGQMRDVRRYLEQAGRPGCRTEEMRPVAGQQSKRAVRPAYAEPELMHAPAGIDGAR
jgi:hypothetical protein